MPNFQEQQPVATKKEVFRLPVSQWRVYLPFMDRDVSSMLTRKGASLVPGMQQANIVVFTGGADVCPILYGEMPIPGTNYNLQRDREEIKVFKSVHPDVPKVGICRGAQFLNIMCGGKLWQDVDNHAMRGTHPVYDSLCGIADLTVTSTHHQMMVPNNHLGYEFLSARCSTTKKREGLTEHSESAPLEEYYEDCEGVYYDNFNSLCFQPHPEYGHKPTEDYFWSACEMLLDWRHEENKRSIRDADKSMRAKLKEVAVG